MKLKKTVVTAVLLLSLQPMAHAGCPFNVDDPGTDEPQHVVLNLAAVTSQVSGSESDLFPSANFGYGLNNNFEVDLGSAIDSVRNSGSPRIFGYGDTTLYAKWRFLEETSKRPQVALTGLVKFPTASRQRGLGSGYYDYIPALCLAKSFGRYFACANAGYNILGDPGAISNTYYGLCVTYQATELLTIGGQLYGSGSASPGTSGELAYGLGLTYNYRPDQAFQLTIGRSARGLSDLNVYAGFQFDLGAVGGSRRSAPPATAAPTPAT